MSEILVRPAGVEDAGALARIWLEVCEYYAAMDPEAFQVPDGDGLAEWFASWLRVEPAGDELTLVAELDGVVVGDIEAKLVGPAADARRQMLRELGATRLLIESLAVARAHWRSGVGSALMAAAEEWGRGNGATLVATYTYVDSPVSVPFYEARGFRRRSLNLRKRL